MQPRSNAGAPAGQPGLENTATAADLTIAPGDLDKLARWVPPKEMALLAEVCERAQADPDLLRPALLLCSAYAERIARMLDQDPFPTVTHQFAMQLQRLRARNGL